MNHETFEVVESETVDSSEYTATNEVIIMDAANSSEFTTTYEVAANSSEYTATNEVVVVGRELLKKHDFAFIRELKAWLDSAVSELNEKKQQIDNLTIQRDEQEKLQQEAKEVEDWKEAVSIGDEISKLTKDIESLTKELHDMEMKKLTKTPSTGKEKLSKFCGDYIIPGITDPVPWGGKGQMPKKLKSYIESLGHDFNNNEKQAVIARKAALLAIKVNC